VLTQSILTLLLVAAQPSGTPAPATPPLYQVTVDITDSIRALGSDDLFVSEPAAQRIVALGVAAVPALTAALARQSPEVRAGIADVLGRIGEPECLPPLLTAARDDVAAVRAAALDSLGELGDPTSAPVVERALQDSDEKVRLAAVGACAEICLSKEAFTRIAELAMREPSSNMLPRARDVLRKIWEGKDAARAARARRSVGKAVAAELRHTSQPDVQLRGALLASDLGESSALATLRRAMRESDNRPLKLQAIFTLMTSADVEAAAIVAEQTHDPFLGPAACQALKQIALKNPAAAGLAHASCRAPAPAGPHQAKKRKGPGTSSPALE
jgi:HEAT repeat protein